MSLESLELRIIDRVSKQVEEIISKAEEKAKSIIEEARSGRKKIIESDIEPELRVARRKIVGRAGLEGKRAILLSKEDVTSRVFQMATERMKKIAAGKDKQYNYEKILKALLKEAALRLQEKEIVVAANKRDSDYIQRNIATLRKALSKDLGFEVKIKLADKPADCIGGVIVYDKSKNKTFYNTLEGRLEGLKETLRSKVTQTLFVGENV